MIYLKYKFYNPKGELIREFIKPKENKTNQQFLINSILKEMAEDYFGRKDLTDPMVEDYINHCTYTINRCNKEGKALYKHIIIRTPYGDKDDYYFPIGIDGSTFYSQEACSAHTALKYYDWDDKNYSSWEYFAKACIVELDEIIKREE